MSNPNLANFVVIPFAASGTPVVAMEMGMSPGYGNLLTVKVESLDDDTVANCKMQGKETAGGTYVDVAGTTVAVNPRGAAAFAAAVGPFFQFVVSGGYGRIIVSLDSPAQELQVI